MNVVNILNTIRANASKMYQDRVPEATKTNLSTVGNPILTYQPVGNEFLSILINRIALVTTMNKRFTNPLAKFKGQDMPFGYSIQNIYTNPVKAKTFTTSIGDDLLKRSLPETAVEYYSVNRQDVYPVTISDDMLAQAFTSENDMESFINGIFNALYSGDAIDEFLLMKQLFVDAVTNEKIVTVELTSLDTREDVNLFAKTIKKLGYKFQFPSTDYNKYNKDELKVVTWTNPEDILLLIDSDYMTEIDFEVLAVAFNMDKVTFLGNVIPVDNFGGSDIVGVLCDRHTIKVNDTKYTVKEFENGLGLYKNHFLHHWQILSISQMANAVAFTLPSE